MVARSIATAVMWVTYLAMLYFSQGEIGGNVIGLGLVLMIPLIVANGAMWGMFKDSDSNEKHASSQVESLEKRKRDRLDAVLRELSDEQLAALKDRLSEPDFEERVAYMLGDDGELVQRGE